MPLEFLCTVIIGIIFGLIVTFAGYRFFLLLLPIWGFFAGFALGATAMTTLFGTGFLATTTSWVVGFVVAVVFALLAYLFYAIGVAIVAGTLGYALGSGLVFMLFPTWNIVAFLIGIVAAVILIAVTFLFNLQKVVIVLLTAFGGAGSLIGVALLMFGGVTTQQLGDGSVMQTIRNSPFWLIVWLVLGAVGVFIQYRTTTRFVYEEPGYMERSF